MACAVGSLASLPDIVADAEPDWKQIFLSYSTKDIQFARYLHALLEDEGFSVWMDKTCLDTGMDWCGEIEKNLDACAAFVVVMSPESHQSNFVKSEVFHAMDRDKPIFPVLLAGEEPLFYLKAYQWEDMREGLSAKLSPSFVDSLKNKVLPPVPAVPQGMAIIQGRDRVRFDIVGADVLNFRCDVLVLKHADGFMGCDAIVASELRRTGTTVNEKVLRKGSHILTPTNGALAAGNVLFVPTEGLRSFGYKSIRAFTRKLFEILSQQETKVPRKHVAMTIHGVGFGLDEAEALMAELGGIMDCLNGAAKQDGNFLCGVERISIIEIAENRVTRLRETADEHFGGWVDDSIAQKCEDDNCWGYNLVARTEKTGSPGAFKRQDSSVGTQPVGETRRGKPYALIITSNDESQEDIFYYGIQQPVHAMGLLCERVVIKCITSPSETTRHHLERMEDARIVVCDISIVSPMLYFYLGYAMGKKIPIAFVSNSTDPHFDQDHYHTIVYSKIWELEELLRQWLKRTLAA